MVIKKFSEPSHLKVGHKILILEGLTLYPEAKKNMNKQALLSFPQLLPLGYTPFLSNYVSPQPSTSFIRQHKNMRFSLGLCVFISEGSRIMYNFG